MCRSDYPCDSHITQQLQRRGLVRLSGKDSAELLQGLITNDIRCFDRNFCQANSLQQSLHAFMLNIQGRVLWDMIVYRMGEDNNKHLIECDKDVINDLIKHLTKYRLRKKVDIADVSAEVKAWIVIPCAEKQFHISTSDCVFSCSDPRVPHLGYRIILPEGVSATTVIQECKEADDNRYYEWYRYNLGVGEGMLNHPVGACFPLEANGDYLHAVSFCKGCYIGQELTSRTHHTGVTRKRLMPLLLLEESEGIELDAKVVNESGKGVGKMRGHVRERGLGLLRVADAVNHSLNILYNDDKKMGAKAIEPDWWKPDFKVCEAAEVTSQTFK